jgi:hypothetical protein
MSQLEERAKPILLPLMAGEKTNLSPEAQRILATWATKTAMVAERSFPREIGISQAEREWIKNRDEPPLNWRVWIAAYDDAQWKNLSIYQHRGRLQHSPIRRPGVATYYVQTTLFGLNHVLFLVGSTFWPGFHSILQGGDRASVLDIWPPRARSLLWPPARILRDPQANALANVLTLTKSINQSLNRGANWAFTL